MEKTLLLHDHPPGSLIKLDRYLHKRADGMIGPLSHAFRGAAIDVNLSGTEHLTNKGLDAAPLDHAAEAAKLSGCHSGLAQWLRCPSGYAHALASSPTPTSTVSRANHLRPSYPRCFLSGPPFWFGKPQMDRLAAISGRSEQHGAIRMSMPTSWSPSRPPHGRP
ncbi:hypothetical protein [Streptomyces rochei]|uniref:hypothetical protein n=1 Tax=Streptomyces rochei TaxID=1928 RepID=UPI0037A24424